MSHRLYTLLKEHFNELGKVGGVEIEGKKAAFRDGNNRVVISVDLPSQIFVSMTFNDESFVRTNPLACIAKVKPFGAEADEHTTTVYIHPLKLTMSGILTAVDLEF